MADLTPLSEQTISTDSADAVSACTAAQASIVYRRSDAMSLLSDAIAADPDSAYIQSVYGLMLVAARKSALNPQIHDALGIAKSKATSATKREQAYVAALDSVANGNAHQTATIFEDILEQHPSDLLALTFLQGELFWAGDMPASEKISRQLAKHWQVGMPDYAAFLANRAFDMEEINQFEQAENMGRAAIEIDQRNIWAAHAVAHVLYMQNRNADGAAWVEQLSSNWGDANQMQFHLWWHHCLFLLEQHKHDEVLALYDSHVRNQAHPLVKATPDLFLDIQNCASLLWRLETAGADVGDRWHQLSDAVTPRIDDISSPFTSAHIALVLAATGNTQGHSELLNNMKDYAQSHQTELAISVAAAIPAVNAAMHHRQQQHEQVRNDLLPNLDDLHLMGGSHAQQDVFWQLMFDSASALNDSALTRSLHHRIEAIGFHEPADRVMYSV